MGWPIRNEITAVARATRAPARSGREGRFDAPSAGATRALALRAAETANISLRVCGVIWAAETNVSAAAVFFGSSAGHHGRLYETDLP